MEGEIERGEGREREKWKPRRGIMKEKNESNSEDGRREEMRRAEYKIQSFNFVMYQSNMHLWSTM